MKKLSALAAIGLLCQGCVTTTSSSIAPQSDEDAAIANLNLGIGYLRQGRPDLAVDILGRALEFDPDLADAHSSLAVAHDQLGETEEAEEHYRRATRIEPQNAAAANSYAVFLCRHDRWEDAQPYFRRAAENPRYPTPEAALTNAGVCARTSGDLATAETYFRDALQRNPAYPDALFHMTDLAFRKGNFLQARAFAQRSLEATADSPELYWLCYQIENELQSPESAQDCAAQLRENFPESVQASQLFELERDGPR
jgi:type IV pilus assembly protein PilF